MSTQIPIICMSSTLGYWNVRGFAQPIRLLLAYVGEDVDEKRYNISGSAPDWDRSDWLKVKYKLGLDFPNLPYYVDNFARLTQTLAIMKYLGRKYNLVPHDENERIRVEMMEGEGLDLRSKWVAQCYGNFVESYDIETFNKRKPEFVQNTKTKLDEISAFLGASKFIAGEHLTYVDFFLYELLDIHLALEPTILDGDPNLTAYHARIQELPPIAAYIQSDKFIKGPINGPMAVFAGGTHPGLREYERYLLPAPPRAS